MSDRFIRVEWYEHDCEWISKYCDEHHTRSATVALDYLTDPVAYEKLVAREAWEEGFDAGERDVFMHDTDGWDKECIENPYESRPVFATPPTKHERAEVRRQLSPDVPISKDEK